VLIRLGCLPDTTWNFIRIIMKFAAPPRRFSQRDIAKELGVSHVTVSMALRNNPRISERVRGEIREFADRMGYKPDPMLSALSSYRLEKTPQGIHSSIAWLDFRPASACFSCSKELVSYWDGAYAAAEKAGYRLEKFPVTADISPKRLNDILTTRGVRGILLPPQQNLSEQWKEFPWSSYSVVRFSRAFNLPNARLVTADEVANTMLAFEEIQKRGYHRIGLVTEDARIDDNGHMFEGGFILAQRNVEPHDRVPVFPFSSFPAELRADAISAWMNRSQVDAILTDIAEVPALLATIGVNVPEDVGLAVTNVLDGSTAAGINQHPEEIGRIGFHTLNSLINEGAQGLSSVFRQNLIEGSWMDGGSMPVRETAH
jgi:LacI family transcriptional regulator